MRYLGNGGVCLEIGCKLLFFNNKKEVAYGPLIGTKSGDLE